MASDPEVERIDSLLADTCGAVLRRRGCDRIPDPSLPLTASLDSIDLQRVAVELATVLEVRIPLRLLFDAPSRAQLARSLASLANSGTTASHLAALERATRRERTNLGFSQERLAFMQRIVGGSAAYHSVFCLRVEGALDAAAVTRGLRRAVLPRAELQSAVVETAEGFRAVRVALPLQEPEILELDSWEEPVVLRLAGEFAGRPFDLAAGPSWRLQWIRVLNRHQLTFSFHHAVIDQHGFEVLLADFWRGTQEDGAEAPAGSDVSFTRHAAWHRHWFREHGFSRQRDFWVANLTGAALVTLEPCRPRPLVPTYSGRRHALVIDEPRWRLLESRAAAEGATLAMLLHAVLAHLLRLETGQDDVTVGLAVSARTHAGADRLSGVLVNTLALRLDMSGCVSFRDLLRAARERFIDALEHQDMPFDVLVKQLRLQRRPGENPLFGVMLNVLNIPPEQVLLPGLSIHRVEVDRQASQFDLTVTVDRQHGRTIHFEYATDLYDERRIACIAARFDALLARVEADCGQPLATLPHLGPEEARDIERWSEGAALPEVLPSVAQRLEAMSATHADRTAVSAAGHSLSYRALSDRVRVLAAALRRATAPGTRVGLMLDRDENLPVVLLAALHAGVPFVPLDAGFPPGRLGYIAGDADVSLLVAGARTDVAAPGWLPEGVKVRSVAELLAEPAEDAAASVVACSDPAQAAYVLYTSGTTGRPKGVVVSQGALAAFLQAMSVRPGMRADDRLLAVTTIGFDISLLELLLPCWCGAEVVIAARDEVVDAGRLAGLLAAHAITVLQATPSAWLQLVESGWHGSPRLRAFIGGEPLPPELAAALHGRVSALWNLYGPTETTIWSTCDRVGRQDVGPHIPVGRPIDGTRVFILDGAGRRAGVGVRGEIVIGGRGVADGYLGQQELTLSRFVPLPGDPGAGRFYRTGDVGRWRADGRIECLGRLDDQIKVRGHRIEPGEIEAIAGSVPGVRRAAAVVLRRSAADVRIALFVATEAPQDLLVATLRAALRAGLPDYMLPQHIQFLPQLPLLPNGKIDRTTLSGMEPEATSAGDVEPPQAGLELELAALWRELLGQEVGSRHDNFFEIGGHSLLAMRLVTRIREDLRRQCNPAQVFRSPTLAGLAQVLGSTVESESSQVVTLRAGDEGPPLFCICGINLYRALAARLSGEYAVVAIYLEMESEQATSDTAGTVSRLAARYAEAIRGWQPAGPYRLAGFSFGGVLAHEIARQLRASGLAVEVLVILDSDVPGRAAESPPLRIARAALARLRGRSAAEHPFYERAIRDHPATCGDSRTLFIEAAAAHRYDPGYGWNRLCANLHVVSVSCDHDDLLQEPHVVVTASAIDTALAQAPNPAR